MSKRKKRHYRNHFDQNLKDLDQLLNFFEALQTRDFMNVTRYTYDAWKKCYPGSTYEQYVQAQHPENLMDCLARALSDWPEEIIQACRHVVMRPVLLDDDYFAWLGDRKNTEATRLEYITQAGQDEETRVRKLMDAGLLYSNWTYAITAMGALKNRFMGGDLSQECAEAITEFLRNYYAPGEQFEVYTVPYLMKWDRGQSDAERFISMAHDSFAGKASKPQVRYQNLTFKEGVTIYHVCVPFVIRETHKTGCLTIGDIYDYMTLYYNDEADAVIPNARKLITYEMSKDIDIYTGGLPESQAGKLLAEELAGKSGITDDTHMSSVFPFVTQTSKLAELFEESCQSLSDACQASEKATYKRI